VAAQVRETYRDLPVQHVFFWVSLAGMPEDMVMRHVQALCSMQPLLADSAP
jgi:hypothetical protein